MSTRIRSNRPKRRAAGDETLLAAIESCWAMLATGILRRNPAVELPQVQTAARRFVELLVFLRMGQDRGVLPVGSFGGLIGNSGIQRRLRELLAWIENRFGPGLFHARQEDSGRTNQVPPPIPPIPSIDEESLNRVLAQLAQHDAQWDLAGCPVEILGRIHERLLGRRLRPGGDGTCGVEDDRQPKKTGGVFYTPDYVVRYIVKRAVLDRLEALASRGSEKSDFEVLDPACGCGGFLVGACREMLRWCGRRHVSDGRQLVARQIRGVDVDPEAVLVARRSLWLELLSEETRSDARNLLDELTENIRPGDALTGVVLEPMMGRVDAVIGNPPYRRELDTKHLLDRIAATDFGRRYRAPRMDLWYYFVHRGLELLKPGGRLSFIVGSYWTKGKGAGKLVHALRETAHIDEIFSLDRLNVFPNVAGRHMILTVSKGTSQRPTIIKTAAASDRLDAEPFVSGAARVTVFRKTAGQLFRAGRIDLEPPSDDLLAKLTRWRPLDTLGDVRQGIAENPAAVTPKTNRKHGNRWLVGEGVFALTPGELDRLHLPDSERRLIRPYHHLCDLGRYFLAEEPSLVLVYSTQKTCPDVDRFPAIRQHLGRFRPIMEARRETRRGVRAWWQLHWPRDAALWRSQKLIAVQMARRPAFVPATRPVYVPFSTNVFVPRADVRERLGYFAAVLNSRLMWKWFRHHAKRRGVGLEINGRVLAQTPIRRIDFSNPADAARHDRLLKLVDRMLVLTRRFRRATESERAALQERVAATDRRIDALVYELYELSDAEIGLVETATQIPNPKS